MRATVIAATLILLPSGSNLILSSISPYENGGCLTRHLVDPGLATSPNINVHMHTRFLSVFILYAIVTNVTTIFRSNLKFFNTHKYSKTKDIQSLSKLIILYLQMFPAGIEPTTSA